MPIINLNKTNLWNSLILQSVASSLVIVLALVAKDYIDKYNNKDKDEDNDLTFLSVLSIFSFTFVISLIAYGIMYYVFGYTTV